ncbi:hypothetical protein [Streptomyces sp. NPDC015131]|uniref:hypothetical protein n=1 Tax=Streptomyces sp. NPDC015131 TaxID=3364941 RepID=UPI0036F56B3F
MGTDIHGVLQTRYAAGGYWYTDCRMEDDRNYRLFAALADVRNGAGFAGVKTHEPIEPIAAPRDWPKDFNLDSTKGVTCGYDEEPWLGDHSFSWLSLPEVMDWKGWDQPLNECGYISRAEYESWDRVSPPPKGWSGGISGRNIVLAEDGVPPPPGWTHVRVYWTRPLRESCETFLAWTRYAAAKAGGYEARIVFGFDS